MMWIPAPQSQCSRAREAVSGGLDGELSQLDAARLDAHLRSCAACREFAAQTAALTTELRRAPLEPLAAPAFVPRQRRRAASLRVQAAAAAAVAVAATGSLVLGRIVGSSGSTAPTAAAPATVQVTTAEQEAVDAHVLALLPTADRERASVQTRRVVPL